MVPISIVILSHNRLGELSKNLPRLLSESHHPDEFQIIVVDNNSTDGSREFLQEMQIERPVAERLLPAALSAAGLITFFTVKGPEVRAWLLADGAPAVDAAGKIHSDLERGFIRAEVVHFDDLQALGSVKEARAKGRARVEGKEYRVQDGDILDIRFNV